MIEYHVSSVADASMNRQRSVIFPTVKQNKKIFEQKERCSKVPLQEIDSNDELTTKMVI